MLFRKKKRKKINDPELKQLAEEILEARQEFHKARQRFVEAKEKFLESTNYEPNFYQQFSVRKTKSRSVTHQCLIDAGLEPSDYWIEKEVVGFRFE